MVTTLEQQQREYEERDELDRQKTTIMQGLRSGVVRVEFTKVDGTNRVMICSLNSKYLPETDEVKVSTQSEQKNAIAVFDLEKNKWRSFRFSSVKGFTTGVNYD